MMVMLVLNALLFIFSVYFMFASNVFEVNYGNIFALSDAIRGINYGFLIGFIISFALMLSIISVTYLKKRNPYYYLLAPLIFFTVFFAFFSPKYVFTYFVIGVMIIGILYFSRKAYLKKSIYKLVPYDELSGELIKKVLFLFTIGLSLVFTYTAIQQNNFSSHVDTFFYKHTGLWLNGSANAYDLVEQLDSQQPQPYELISEIKPYLLSYFLYSNSSSKEECISLLNNAFDFLENTTSSYQPTRTYDKAQMDKLNVLFDYRALLIKFYPYIVFGLYYALFSLLFWIIGFLASLFSYIANKIVEEGG